MTDELKAQAEDSNWHVAHEWSAGLGLEYNGVDLGRALVYDVLRVTGNIWKVWTEQQAASATGAPNA